MPPPKRTAEEIYARHPEVLEAVERAAQSREVPKRLLRALENAVAGGDRVFFRRVPILTKRQREVLRLSECGLQHKQIALALGIGVQTVKSHSQQARRRLSAPTTAQAVFLAREKGLL